MVKSILVLNKHILVLFYYYYWRLNAFVDARKNKPHLMVFRISILLMDFFFGLI